MPRRSSRTYSRRSRADSKSTRPAVQIIRVGLVRDAGSAAPGSTVTTAADVIPLLTELLSADREHFLAIHLNTRNIPIATETVSIGALNATLVHPREVFKAAILNNAAGLILAHNHPSGDPTPSKEDLALTRRMMEAGELLGIDVFDHVIVVPDGRYISLKEAGLL